MKLLRRPRLPCVAQENAFSGEVRWRLEDLLEDASTGPVSGELPRTVIEHVGTPVAADAAGTGAGEPGGVANAGSAPAA